MSCVTTNNFAILLAQKRLRVSKVARDTGISRTTLTNLYYSRGNAISFDVLGKLCEYFGCQIEDLVNLDKGESA